MTLVSFVFKFLGRGLFVLLAHPVIALLFEMQGQVGTARFDDASVQHNVNIVGFDVVQQALIMGDDQHAEFGSAQGVDAFGNDAQRVDVETRIGLIQNGDLRFEGCHL